jgi:phage portal protein BeeE
VQPQVIVALGASAARALLRRRVVLANERGLLQSFGEGRQLLVTVYPSYLLRVRDAEAKAVNRGGWSSSCAARGRVWLKPRSSSAELLAVEQRVGRMVDSLARSIKQLWLQ